MAGGIVIRVLSHLHKLGHLKVILADFEIIKATSKEIRSNAHVLPVIVAAVQSLACTPGLRVALGRWAKQDNQKYRVRVSPSEPAPPEISPWEEEGFWPFATWALASQVTSRFVGQFRCAAEGVFLENLCNYTRQLESDQWVLPLVVATLYVIKDAVWSWPLLLRYDPH
jgi:hypothetical protein